MQVLRLEPCAETRIVNLRMALPEIGPQIAHNLEMAQMQFDMGDFWREIALRVVYAHMESGDSWGPALCSDNHNEFLRSGGSTSVGSPVMGRTAK